VLYYHRHEGASGFSNQEEKSVEGAMLYYGEHMNECAAQLQAAGSEEEDGRRVGGQEAQHVRAVLPIWCIFFNSTSGVVLDAWTAV